MLLKLPPLRRGRYEYKYEIWALTDTDVDTRNPQNYNIKPLSRESSGLAP